MYQIRKPVLKIAARIGITEEANNLLTAERKSQKKSKAQIISDLIIEKYGKNKLRAD